MKTTTPNPTIFNDLPTATYEDLEQFEEVIDNWRTANELLDDEIIAKHFLSPVEFMRQFSNFLQIPYTHYFLYIDTENNGKQTIYKYDGRVLVHNVDKIYGACDSTLIYESGGKRGLIDYDYYDTVIPAIYDDIRDEGVGSTYIFTKDGVEGQVTYGGRFYSLEEIENFSDEQEYELAAKWIWAVDTV